MDFVIGLRISTNWKRDSYNSILIIVDWLTKMVHYKPVKITINALRLAKIIIDVVVWHHGLPNSIVTDKGSLFTSKFWSSLCYFFGIKYRLSTIFHLQTNGQTERQNSTIETYLRAFINFKQNDWARLLLMAKFVYNNVKNASISLTPFELNYGYCKNGQRNNKHTRLIERDDQRKWKKSRDTSHADITDLWRSKEVALLAKSWRGVQLTQLYKLSWTAPKPRAKVTGWGHVQGSHAGATCRGHVQGACELPRVICIYKWVEL